MRYRIALLAIVGMIAALPPAFAATTSKKAVVPVSLSQSATSIDSASSEAADAALAEARRLFVRGDPIRFEAAAARASDSSLASYLEFWRQRMRLQDKHPDAGTGAADAAILRFIDGHPDSIVADLMRRDWMLDLGKRHEWNLFDAQYAAWVLRDGDQIDCLHWLGRVERGLPADEALAALNAPRNLGEHCSALAEAMLTARRLDRKQLFARLLAGLEENSRDTVTRIAELLDFDPVTVAAAWQRPAKALAADPGREIALIALVRIARDDPQAAARRLGESAGPLNAADTLFVWSQIAASGMRHLAPEAFAWSRRGSGAQITDATLVWMARAALREQDWKTLRSTIARMSDEGRRDPAWIYWDGRALIATGQPEAGQALLRQIAGRYHFYGQLASEEIGEPQRTPTPAAPASTAELAAVASNPGFARALKFYDIGLRLEGNREWNYQLRGMSDRQLLAAAGWACQRQILDRCVNTADRTLDQHDFGLRFVAPFKTELEPVAVGRGLDPAWIYGLIRQESRFIMDARSSAGAQGLMQIMPATGRWIAGKLGVKNFHPSQLNDLPTNLEFGTFYLKTVLDDLAGSPVLASAAYNAGPGRSRNWRASLSAPVEGAIFAEIIPFAETRNYVKNVLSNAVIYSQLFTGKPQSLKVTLGSIAPLPPVSSDVP